MLEPHQAAASLSLPQDLGALLPSKFPPKGASEAASPPAAPQSCRKAVRELLGESLWPRGLEERGLRWRSVSLPSPPPSLPCHGMAVGSGDLVPTQADSIRVRILSNAS